ncbi:hypothetical protein [Photobacterium profundum]|nr:hypothetical protein [Photobacterium profundum]
MKKLALALFSVVFLNSASAKEQVVELDIPTMTCPVCPLYPSYLKMQDSE